MNAKEKTYKITNIISAFVLIIAYGFIMAQSFINIIYNMNERNNIIAERLVYEQFAHEVYSNINSKLIKEIDEIDINKDCNYTDGFTLMNFPIKIQSFYDCEGVNNDAIDKNICQNKITSETLCCRQTCCFKGITNKKENFYCLDKSAINEIDKDDEDIRNLGCSKYSIYNGRFYKINNMKICVKKDNKNYEDLLKNSESEKDDCYGLRIYYDSKYHYFCDKEREYVNVRKNAIIKNIFSVETPNYFEMESTIRMSRLLNKIKLDEDKIAKEKKKIGKISAKSIYDAFMDNKCRENECKDGIQYERNKILNLRDIIQNSNENIFNDFKYYIYDKNKKISWYTRNYIGFSNYTELKKFKKFFDENDHKNNCLYKISNNLYPCIVSFIIGAIICIVSIIFISFSIKNYKNGNKIDLVLDLKSEEEKSLNMNLAKFILIFLSFIAYLILYLVESHKYEEINIDMEEFFSKVIKKYNSRRKQIFLLIGLILFGFNFFMELIILNLKCDLLSSKDNGMNGKSVNSVTVFVKLTDVDCEKKHQCKLYLNSIFKDNIKKIKRVLSLCDKCSEDTEVDIFKLNNIEININNRVGEIGVRDGALIYAE